MGVSCLQDAQQSTMSQLCFCKESQTRSSESIPDAQQDPLRAFLEPPEPPSLNPFQESPEPSSLDLFQEPSSISSLEIPDSQDSDLSLEIQPFHTKYATDTLRDEQIAIQTALKFKIPHSRI